MKKTKYLISFFFMMMICLVNMSSVDAFDRASVNLNNDINFPSYIDDNVIKIWLKDELKNNNETIKYQFIEITEAEANAFSLASDNINNDLEACREKAKEENDYDSIRKKLESEGKDYYSDQQYRDTYNNYADAYNACNDTYNKAINEYYKSLPLFDETKWQTQTISEETSYSIDFHINEPTDKQYFIMWVKAKDENNDDIYSLGHKKSSSYVEPEKPGTSEDKEEQKQPEKEEQKQPEKEEVKEEQKQPEKEEVKEEQKQPEKEEVKDVEETVENPPTGLYISLGMFGVLVIGVAGYVVLQKKNYFNKI